MNEDESSRPNKVGQAVILLYATLAVGVVRGILEGLKLSENVSVSLLVFVAIVTFGSMLFVIHMIGTGRNWARVTFLVMFILGIPLFIEPLLESLAASPVSGVLGIGQAVIQAVALVLLFQALPGFVWESEAVTGRNSADAIRRRPLLAFLGTAINVLELGQALNASE